MLDNQEERHLYESQQPTSVMKEQSRIMHHKLHELNYHLWHIFPYEINIILTSCKVLASVLRFKPRKMCLKCHSFPWRSVATNSCHGGCWDMSCRMK